MLTTELETFDNHKVTLIKGIITRISSGILYTLEIDEILILYYLFDN